MSTELQKHEDNKLLHFADREIAKAETVADLYASICELVVGVGGFVMAWIGLPEYDAERRILPVAHAGYDSHYIETAKVTWNGDDVAGAGTAGTAVREGTVEICNSTATETRMRHWRARLLARGFASSASFPLHDQGEVFGVLGVYARAEGWFGPAEVETLTALAEKVSAAVKQLRLDALKRL